jgi:wyosine [tRNA(Phe)-imidazoG37] synthetase (radical SAM superfamily)
MFNSIFGSVHKKHTCLAPYNSIFFSMNGSAYFCLCNKKQLLGKYPESSVDEIILGDIASKYRQQFLKESLLDGCENCKNHLKNGTGDIAFYNLHKWYPPRYKDFYPRYIDFELDNRCNLSCIMCKPYFSSSIPEKNGDPNLYKSPYDDHFIQSFDKYAPHLLKAHFRGGEPFLIKRYHQFWERLLEKGKKVHIGVTTNGTVMTDNIRKFVESGRFDINISIDSLQKETYEKIRRGAEFKDFYSNLNYMISVKDQGKCQLSACICLMSLNWQEFPDVISFCSKNDIRVYINYVEMPYDLSLRSLDAEKILSIRDFLLKSETPDGSLTANYNSTVYKSVLQQLENWAIYRNGINEKVAAYNKSIPAEKATFFAKLEEYLQLHPEYQAINKQWFINHIDAVQPKETAGFPIDLLYISFKEVSIEMIVQTAISWKEEQIDKMIFDRYTETINKMQLSGNFESSYS